MATKSLSRPILIGLTSIPLAYTLYSHRSTFSLTPRAHAESATTQEKSIPTPTPNKIFNGSLSFIDLKLTSSEQVSPDTRKLKFEFPREGDVSGVDVISAVMTKANINGSWIPTLRPYSPINDPATPGHLTLVVKHYPSGPMSNHLHSLTPGQTLSFLRKPLPSYTHTPNTSDSATPSHLVLIAGGAGITPMYQLTQHIFRDRTSNPGVDDDDEKTKVTIIFGVNTPRDLLFHSEFASLRRKHPARFHVVYTVTESAPTGTETEHVRLERPGTDLEDVNDSHTYKNGRITPSLLHKHLPPPGTPGLKILFCGPPAMEEAIVGKKGMLARQGPLGGVLKELGYKHDEVFKL